MSLELHYESPPPPPLNPPLGSREVSTELAAVLVLLCSSTCLIALSWWLALSA